MTDRICDMISLPSSRYVTNHLSDSIPVLELDNSGKAEVISGNTQGGHVEDRNVGIPT